MYLKAALAIAFCLVIIGTYAFGRHDGQAIEVASQVRASKAAEAVRIEKQAAIDKLTADAAAREDTRQGAVREIRHDTQTIIERPVYRNVCVDADGLRILTRSAAVANGQPSTLGDAPASASTASQP